MLVEMYRVGVGLSVEGSAFAERTGNVLVFSDSRQRKLMRTQWKVDANCLQCFNSVLWAAKEEAQLYLKSKSAL